MGKQLPDLPGQRVKWFPLSLVSVQHGKKDLFTTKYYCEIFEDFCPSKQQAFFLGATSLLPRSNKPSSLEEQAYQ